MVWISLDVEAQPLIERVRADTFVNNPRDYVFTQRLSDLEVYEVGCMNPSL